MVAITIPLAILGLIIYSYWIWNKCSLAFPFTIIFLIEIAWGTLSIIWIDSGIYITEQLRDSYTTGAALRYISLMLPFALVFPHTLEKKILREKYKTVKLEISGTSLDGIVWKLCVISVGYVLLDLMLSGTPLLSSTVTKIGYYAKFSKLPFAGTLHNIIMPFAMLLSGIRFIRSERKSKEYYEALAIAVLIIIIQILMDNKFYGFESKLKKVVKGIVKNYQKELKRRKKNEIPFCELPEIIVEKFTVWDDYETDYTIFNVCGNDIRVYDDELAEALKKLSDRNRENLLMYYFLEMNNEEIARVQNISRSGVFQNRYNSLELMKKILKEEK